MKSWADDHGDRRDDRHDDGYGYVGPPGTDAERIIEVLQLEPLPEEGGRWSQVLRNAHSSAIYYLLTADDFSAFHRLSGPETYHFYMGWPLRLSLLLPDGSTSICRLGPWLNVQQRPALTVDGGVWQASRSDGSKVGGWTLVGTTMAPPYRQENFELGRRAELVAKFPAAEAEIVAHTRPQPT